MKTKIKFIAPIALTVTFVFALAYGINTKFEPIFSIFSPSNTDTPTEEPTIPAPGDISQMFNERGFYKSNSFGVDENEIINDFNGNLIYEIPMYQFKGDGDINMDMKLVYNGSVDHQIMLRDSSNYQNPQDVFRYNINSPEWILSVNGFGVQTLNFETRLLTKPQNNQEITGNEVKKLIPGYHFDNKMLDVSPGERDRIRILSGDGSVITLVNKNESPTGAEVYTGTYYGDSKGSHYKANVYFNESGTDYIYMKRTVELMTGDGLLYIFKEHKPNYEDVTTSSHISPKRPKVFLLTEIRDMFGHKFYLTYDDNSAALGRPRLYTAGFGTVIEYGYPNGIKISNYYQGDFIIIFDDYINYTRGGNKYAFPYRVKNPVKQEAIISSQGYQRKLIGLPLNDLVYSYMQSINCNDLKRIGEFRNFLGGKKTYQYLDGNQCAGGVCITISYPAAMVSYYSLGSTLHEGYGRDPFYVNMVTNKKVYDEKSVYKSETTFSYDLTDHYIDTNSVFKRCKIDTNDTYFSTKTITSKDGKTQNSSDASSIHYTYRVFPVRPYGTAYNPEVLDISAVTKLVKEEHYNGSSTLKETHIYNYEKGNLTGSIYEGYFSGSFLPIIKSQTIGSSVRQWDYLYEYKPQDAGENKFDSVITQKVEVDPNGIKKQTYFENFDQDINFLGGLPMLGTAQVYSPDTISIIGQKRFFKIGVDTLVRIFKNIEGRREIPEYTGYSDQLLKQTVFKYILDTGNSAGYYGQLRYVYDFAEGTTNNYIETKYEYYRKDTVGRFIYGTNKFRFIEGNLKQVFKPGSQEEKYFYYPVVKIDTLGDYDEPIGSVPLPKTYYKIKFSDGTEEYQYTAFIDTRLPTRIDNYLRTGTSTVDTLKSVSMSYNDKGNPTMIVNENGYLTYISYDNTYGRVKRITLPGDFSKTQDKDTAIVLRNQYFTTREIPADGWGYIDYTTGNNTTWFGDNSSQGCNSYFSMNYQNDNSITKALPFIKFNNINLLNYISVDSAFLALYPQWYTVKHLDSYTISQGYAFNIKGITGFDSPDANYSCYKTQNTVVNSYPVYFPINSNLFRNYLGESIRACENYNYHKVSVHSLLNQFISNDLDLKGFSIDKYITDETLAEDEPNLRFKMIFTDCSGYNHSDWTSNYKPKLTIYGTYETRDTLGTKIYYGGTYLYDYDDVNKTVTVRSRVNHSGLVNNYVKTTYHFDGLGEIRRKDIFKNYLTFDSLLYQFNFANKLARTFDGTGDTTMLSYDYAGRQFKTKNPDETTSEINYSYLQEIQTAFYDLEETFIEKQTLTDETGRYYYKYFDAVGNLLREEKFVAGDINGYIENSDTPFDPDTTFEGQDTPPQMISLITDYKYDNLYRLLEVKTSNNISISYFYDSYGRQVQRRTTDAGNTYYSYDNNNNLVLSQDANQRVKDSKLHTRRTYDGLNRLLTISDYKPGGAIEYENGPMGEDILPFEFDSPPPADSLYIINVYDTITNTQFSSVFSELPSGYSAHNYSSGRLVATAHRTNLGNYWNYKFYRYDQRGNITKMWHKIDGLGWKFIDYSYNSQNQAARLSYQAGQNDGKVFTFGYDDAGRLQYTNLYVGAAPEDPEEENDYPSAYLTMASYTYNADQQVLTSSVNVSNPYTMTNAYNNRNWLKQSFKTGGVFGYTLQYIANGNIRFQNCFGTYTNNFGNQSFLRYTYIYDNSNRLVKADRDSGEISNSYDIINNYDAAGNFVSMKRYGSTNNLLDNFQYSYYNGTNRLKNIGSGSDYTYDANGNVTNDNLNRNGTYKYDWRNLLTEIRSIKTEDGLYGPEDKTYFTIYRYDEAGNRIFKQVWKYMGANPDTNFSGDSPVWQVQSTEYYVRDITGKEIAIYNGSNISQWNIYGLDNVGKINSDNKRYFYLKDHLGSIRATLDTTNAVLSAQDYDPWGYPLENRTWQVNNTKYKFTGKERDSENNYDYFGARYYDSRIAQWTSIDPLFEKHFDYTPYNYVLRSPQRYFDPEGKQEELLGPGYMIVKYYIDVDNKRCTKIRDMNYDIIANSLDMNQAIEKYGELALEKYGGNLQATNIEFDLALLFFTPRIGLTLSSSRNSSKYVIKEYIGKSSDIGLEWLSGKKVTSETSEELGKFLKNYMGEVSPSLIRQKTNLLKIGDLKKIGKEIRLGVDHIHPFEHIDIERNATGELYKNLKLQVTFSKF